MYKVFSIIMYICVQTRAKIVQWKIFKKLQDMYYVYICGNQNIRYIMCMCKVQCIIMYEYNKRAK